jgi:hypothetical protein
MKLPTPAKAAASRIGDDQRESVSGFGFHKAKPFELQISRILRTVLAMFVRRKQTDIVAMVNPAQTSGSHGTTNVIALKAASKF